jgi:hypothetical protein
MGSFKGSFLKGYNFQNYIDGKAACLSRFLPAVAMADAKIQYVSLAPVP